MAPTTQQLIRHGRKKRIRKSKSPRLDKCPQRSGVVLHTGLMKPKKPNSAERKVCRVRLSTGKEVTVYIPGQGHAIQEHSHVLVQGGGPPDLPGVKYRVVRGVKGYDDAGEASGRVNHQDDWRRCNRRSKYGSRKP